MSWKKIRGHDEIVELFRQAAQKSRLGSSFLFTGPPGIGKRTFARKLAAALLCETNDDAMLEPCGQCKSCVQVEAGSHPDLIEVARPEDKSFIPLELLIGPKENRMREGVCHDLAMKPYQGRRKVAIIDDADHFNQEGANSLLKTLEEPPPGAVIILIGTSPSKQLPTIRSRCQLIRFQPLSALDVAELLMEKGIAESMEVAAEAAALSEGSVERGANLLDGDLTNFRTHLHRQLAAVPLDSLRLATAVQTFVDEAGKEASKRRARLREVVQMTMAYYRQILRDRHDPTIAARLEQTLDALETIDRNANLTTLIESWCDGLN